MQLVFEVRDTACSEPPATRIFDGVGGVIGRGSRCDWIIADTRRLVSSRHGVVNYREGHYFLTDISSNGIGVSGSMERLCKGQARLISDGDVYQLGALEICARLVTCERQPLALSDVIPDDAFLGLDPVQAMDREQLREASSQELDALTTSTQATGQSPCHGSVERDHMVLPKWAESAKAEDCAQSTRVSPVATETFWSQFGEALGMPMDTLDTLSREALAIKVAGLLRQTVEGLQQSLRTRDELNSKMDIGAISSALNSQSPLKDCADIQVVLASLLGAGESGGCSAEQVVAQACRDMQTHQLALVVACRAAVRGAVSAFAPGQLLLCFEQERKPNRFSTDGAHWRAYQRHYRRLTDETSFAEQLLGNDFSNAYAEQVRLVSTLYAAYPG